MIKLETFKKAIEAIKKQSEKELKFCKALEDIMDGHFVPEMSSNILEALLSCLKDIFNDREDWVDWWIYDKDFGKNKKLTVYKKGKEIKLDTVEDLYNFLKKK